MKTIKERIIEWLLLLFGFSFYAFNFILFIVVPNIMAFVKKEDMSVDLEILILKSNFVKIIILCIDIIVFYILYKYLKDWFLVKKKSK